MNGKIITGEHFADFGAWVTERDHAQAKERKALAAEVERLKVELERRIEKVCIAEKDAVEAERRRDVAVMTLNEYGDHDIGCGHNRYGIMQCTCGYDEALKRCGVTK